MKKIISLLILSILICINSISVFADTYVKGYTRKDGTYVKGHYRSDRNGTKSDNWSTYGNINPYTGKVGTKKYDSYRNYTNYNRSYKNYNTLNSNRIYGNYGSYNYISLKNSCIDLYGVMSIENSDGTCGCISGYVFGNDNNCVSYNTYCTDKYGFGAMYDNSLKRCACRYGYEVQKDSYGNLKCQHIGIHNKAFYGSSTDTITSSDYTGLVATEIKQVTLKYNTNLRQSPTISAERIRTIPKGEKVFVSIKDMSYADGYYWVPTYTQKEEFGFLVTEGYN